MLDEALQVLLRVYGGFFGDRNNLIVIGFITTFILVIGLTGMERRALSREAMTNTLTTFAILCANIAMAPLFFVVAGKMHGFYESFGIPSVRPEFWNTVPWLLVAAIAVIGKDFCDYWSHRALHMPLLWPIHAVHHSDSHVNGFTTFRVHVLELVVMKAFHIAWLTWLGIPAELVAAAHVLGSMHNAYVHFEVDIDHGPFNWLLASPRFHRWHHADNPAVYGKNLANMIPAWDMMFGTYLKAGPCHEPMGLANDGIPATDPAKLILLPFAMWGQRLKDALGGLFSRARRV